VRQRTASTDDFDYQVERHNDSWCDHIARTNVTAALLAWLQPRSVLDPACGDGSIVLLTDLTSHIDRIVLSDISKPNCVYLANYGVAHIEVHCQSIEDALNTYEEFDAVVLTETLEHLPDPDAILRQARIVGARLIASSPEMRPGQHDTNPEHLWEFDGDGYYEMLTGAGWSVVQKTHLAFPGLVYDFGIWVCR